MFITYLYFVSWENKPGMMAWGQMSTHARWYLLPILNWPSNYKYCLQFFPAAVGNNWYFQNDIWNLSSYCSIILCSRYFYKYNIRATVWSVSLFLWSLLLAHFLWRGGKRKSKVIKNDGPVLFNGNVSAACCTLCVQNLKFCSAWADD